MGECIKTLEENEVQEYEELWIPTFCVKGENSSISQSLAEASINNKHILTVLLLIQTIVK